MLYLSLNNSTVSPTLLAIFAVVFVIIIVLALVLVGFEVKFINRRRSFQEEQAKKQEPLTIVSEDLTIRIRDTKLEAYDTHEEEEAAVSEEAPVEETVEEAEEEEEAEQEQVDGVLIPRVEKLSFAEKYELLEEEYRYLLDEFTAYVVALEDCTKQLQVSSLAFKYRRSQIAKAVIRRDSVYVQFAIHNPEFNRMAREGKTGGLKIKPVEIRLTSRDELEVAKQTADLTVEYIKNEEEYRAEKRREARREAARQRQEEDGIAAEENAEPAETEA